jgi:hypothetical protein
VTPEVTALLDGLKTGDKLGAADVVHVSPVTEGRIDVEVSRGEARGKIFVVKRTERPSPPASTTQYSVFYRTEKSQTPMPNEALDAACQALAERLRKTESSVPAPAGLTSFAADKPPRPSGKPASSSAPRGR